MANEPPIPSATPIAEAKSTTPTSEMPRGNETDEIVIYQHSNIFYWWPVWFFGILFAAVTWLGGDHMAIVPHGTKATRDIFINGETHDVLVLPKDKKLITRKDDVGKEHIVQPTIYVSRYRSLGTVFLFVLLIVIFITNITLRGQWSMIVLVGLSSLVVIFWLAGFWDVIFDRLGQLSIYINLGAYMTISLVLLALWLVNFFFFDRQVYVIVTPGNVRLRLELGAGEMIYDSFQMTVQKKRSDLFRHTFLGFGSGDLEFRFPRVDHPIELHNVLRVQKVLKQIENVANWQRPEAVIPATPAAPPKT